MILSIWLDLPLPRYVIKVYPLTTADKIAEISYFCLTDAYIWSRIFLSGSLKYSVNKVNQNKTHNPQNFHKNALNLIYICNNILLPHEEKFGYFGNTVLNTNFVCLRTINI